MAELFVPTAQQVLAKDPVEGFHQLSQDFASTVLRVFDVLGVYVGKLKPTPRQWTIARRICAKLDPQASRRTLVDGTPSEFSISRLLPPLPLQIGAVEIRSGLAPT